MQSDGSLSVSEFRHFPELPSLRETGILIFPLTSENALETCSLYSDAFLFLLVRRGEGRLLIAGEDHLLVSRTFVALAPEYARRLTEVSSDFRGVLLLVTKSFLDTLPASDKMYSHIGRIMLRRRQVNGLSEPDCLVLSESLRTIQEKLALTGHHLKREMIRNALAAFIFEVSNIWIKNRWSFPEVPHQLRYDYVLKSFFDSLIEHYREEHLVPFYADRLNITPQYLSLIVKSLTGRTPSQFIFERLFCEARVLLGRPELPVKEIAEQLHFSDPSAFGKFFKRHSGISPVDFRKKKNIF